MSNTENPTVGHVIDRSLHLLRKHQLTRGDVNEVVAMLCNLPAGHLIDIMIEIGLVTCEMEEEGEKGKYPRIANHWVSCSHEQVHQSHQELIVLHGDDLPILSD